MQEALLTTKLNIPAPQPNWILRPHQLARLNEGLGRKMTLVCAAAGYGKTVLLAQWARQGPASVGWVSLDEGDNDVSRFLRYLVAAIRCVRPDVGKDANSLEALINDLSRADKPLVVILDDYQTISEEQVHQVVTRLLSHLPPNLHLVIASRADPPLPLARLRAQGALLELRALDLRFRPEEVADYFRSAAVLLEPRQVELLSARTEGWAVGLQLAALSMRGRADLDRFITAFTGRHEYIADYLTDEVLGQLPEELNSFLLQTSILGRMCAPLCQAVIEKPEGPCGAAHWQEQLARLQQQNLFVVPLDDERRWYRYHHLFADLLRQRLQERHPELVPELHQRASRWFEENGLAAEAIHHALAANDRERTAGLVEQAGLMHLSRGEVTTVLGWLGALPESWLEQRPLLALITGMAHLNAGHPGLADKYLGGVQEERLLSPLRGALWAARAQSSWFRGDLTDVLRASDRALAGAETLQTLLVATFSVEALRAGGQLRQAVETCRRTIAQVEGKQPQPDWAAFLGNLMVKLSLLLYEQDQLPAAEANARSGLALVKTAGHHLFEAAGCTTLAMIRLAQGDESEARDTMQRAVAVARRRGVAHEVAGYEAMQVRLHLRVGEVWRAVEWAERFCTDARPFERAGLEVELIRSYTEATLVRVLLAQGLYQQAAERCIELRAEAAAVGRSGHSIELLALQALAEQGRGDSQAAAEALGQALELAREEGYTRTFIDEGAPMRAALARLQACLPGGHPSAGYCRRLLQAFGPAENAPQANSLLVEPLSERELQVLRLLGDGCLNREIADELVITVGTVKRHVNSICGKLEATGRREAVARARTLHLLS